MTASPFGWLFDAGALSPHGFCLLWEPWLIWTHAIADSGIALAYFSIPVALVVFVRRRRDLAMRPVFWLFAAFILLCGAGHAISLATIWTPLYRLEAVIKIATALVSVATAVTLWSLIPKALALPSPAQLEAANVALRESEARHRASFLRSPMALHTLDASGIIRGVSDRWLDLLGYRREEAIGQPIDAFMVPHPPSRHLARVLATGEERDHERRFRHRDGSLRDVLVSARVENPGAGGDAKLVLGALVDVTDRKRAEAALREVEERRRQTQRLEALGQLAGGVAHDFNNVLQVVAGAVSIIESAPDRVDQVQRLARIAAEAARRGAGTSNRLLTFARRSDLRAVAVDAAALLHELAELLKPTLGARVVVKVEAPPELPALLADPGELETVLINLATNARDAMPNGGTLTLGVAAEAVAAEHPAGLARGDYLRLDVADTGIGMDAGTLARATEPFFTTKPLGKGTGLGLSMARGFAEQSGGGLAIESAPGAGARIALWLPRAAGPAQASRVAQRPAAAAVASAATRAVLLVDDEPEIRLLLGESLAGSGYTMTEAADADTALACLGSGLRPDLLITDLTMPGLDGLQLIEAARRLVPGLPAILLTGHPGDAAPDAQGGPFALLRKPVDPRALAERVADLLARPNLATLR